MPLFPVQHSNKIFVRCVQAIAFCIAGLYFPAAPTALAQEPDDTRVTILTENDSLHHAPRAQLLDIVTIGLETFTAPGGGTLFGEYRKLGGAITGLPAIPAPTLSLRIGLTEDFRAVGYGTYCASNVVDIYDVSRNPEAADSAGQGTIVATVVEDFSVKALPVFVGVEFAPVRSQFTSYVGLLAGPVVSSVVWITTARDQAQAGYYRPSINANDWGVGVGGKLYAGLDLRFDRSVQRPIRGLCIEAAFSMMPVHQDVFQPIITSSRGLPKLPERSTTLQMGGFTITIGLNFQFLRKR